MAKEKMARVLPRKFRKSLLLSFILCLGVIYFLPQVDHRLFPGSETPSLITFVGVGLTMVLLTGFALRFGLLGEASYTKQLIIFAFIYNSLIAVSKFTIGPLSTYLASETKAIVAWSFGNPDLLLLLYISALVLLVYLLALLFIYKRYMKKTSKELLKQEERQESKKTKKWLKAVFLILVALLLIVTGGSPLMLPIILSIPALEYLSFVFSTLYGFIIALLLVGAIYYAKKAFKEAQEQALLVKNTTIVVSIFWIGISFLLMYHALWVVYFLILMTLWPLKVVTPK